MVLLSCTGVGLLGGDDVPGGDPSDALTADIVDDLAVDEIVCVADCEGRLCGSDGCGGSCGECAENEVCSEFGECKEICTPDCEDNECGDDGCGSSCGDCGDDAECVENLCIVVGCGDGECGDNEGCKTCPEDCGECPPECGDGNCDDEENCTDCPEDCGDCPPDCGDGECGDDEGCKSCPEDCGVCPCGDGECADDEDCESCPDDCGQCPECGDETCDEDENCDTCPEDCGKCCGNQVCDADFDEDCMNCPLDCSMCCGDGECTADFGEDCGTCPADCGQCCGNGVCNYGYGESCTTCAPDCGACPPNCGNGVCANTETCANCPGDCGECCGDTSCQEAYDESCASCPDDCGECPPDCGNGECGADENCASCPGDCGLCCGNDVCQVVLEESCSTCPDDCGECPDECGDGECGDEENCGNCPEDCGKCCGNGECEPEYGEACFFCPSDCGACPPECGDGECNGDEACDTCPKDCGQCCGDGECTEDEACDTCPKDCGKCCGNLECEEGLDEDCMTCPADCGECPPECGDGLCEPPEENCGQCPDDCKCPGDSLCFEDSCCFPHCGLKECGDDGCGGSCGVCDDDQECTDGICVGGPIDCAGILECVFDCGPDFDCAMACSAQGTPEAQETFADLSECLMAACGFFVVDPACWQVAIEDKCFPEYSSCTLGSCEPDCDGKECGPDGCGGSCGLCEPGSVCNKEGLCEEQADLTCEEILDCTIECGMDPACILNCQSLGSPEGQEMFKELSSCLMKECGFLVPDPACWAKAMLGECAGEYNACKLSGCQSDCDGKQCGPDGCGGLCGLCKPGHTCNDIGQCVEIEWGCEGILTCALECGGMDPGCILQCQQFGTPEAQERFQELTACLMGVCGFFPLDQECILKAVQEECAPQYIQCIEGPCEPDCDGKQCGNDGCGGLCGKCLPGFACSADGQCVEDTALNCEEVLDCVMDCGFDMGCVLDCQKQGTPEAKVLFGELSMCLMQACGGLQPDPACWLEAIAGECEKSYAMCTGGACEPDCLGKECGPDGCGGLCGKCEPGLVCTDGLCAEDQGLTCDEIIDCVMDCGADMGCILDCQKQGTPEAKATFALLAACLLEECGAVNPEPICFAMAVNGACNEEFKECQGGACVPDCDGKECGPDGCGGICGKCLPGTLCSADGLCIDPSGLSCNEILDCALECNMDPMCMFQCQQQGTPEAKSLFGELSECLQNECGIFVPDPACWLKALEQECQKPYMACVEGACVPDCEGKECGPDGCGGSCGECDAGYSCSDKGTCEEAPPGLDCEGIFECSVACGMNPGCILDCQKQGTPEAQDIYQELAQCIMEVCGFLTPSEKCLMDAIEGECAPMYLECIGGPCEPKCDGKECGPDGCGDVCGKCKPGFSCTPEGMCLEEIPGLECQQILSCALQCGMNPNCVMECQQQGTPEAQELFAELSSCLIGVCGFPLEPACVLKASKEECGLEYAACLGEQCEPDCEGKMCGPDGCGDSCGECDLGMLCNNEGMCEGVPMGLTCGEIVDCAMGCGFAPDCVFQCVAQGTPEAQEQWNELYKCLLEACGFAPNPECWLKSLKEECAVPYETCTGQGCVPDCVGKQCGDDGCEGSCGECKPGYLCNEGQCVEDQPGMDCAGILDCAMACGMDFGCALECQAQGTPEAQEIWQKLSQCLMMACGFIGADPACWFEAIEDECAEPYAVCVDQPCEPWCVGLQCGDDGCGGSCGDCKDGFECNAGGQCKELPPQKGCAEIAQCAIACGANMNCVLACQNGASPEAQQLWSALSMCLVQACGFNPDPVCYAKAISPLGACGQEYAACMAD